MEIFLLFFLCFCHFLLLLRKNNCDVLNIFMHVTHTDYTNTTTTEARNMINIEKKISRQWVAVSQKHWQAPKKIKNLQKEADACTQKGTMDFFSEWWGCVWMFTGEREEKEKFRANIHKKGPTSWLRKRKTYLELDDVWGKNTEKYHRVNKQSMYVFGIKAPKSCLKI